MTNKNHKKHYNILLILIASLISISAVAQDNPLSNDLPKIAPASPTVAGLMRFEEIPVSNYTGIPDISIPVFNTKSHSGDVNLALALQYHPSSIAVDEEASYVGLGWNLTGGGTISRTMKGLPDDYSHPNQTKLGIYHASNPYYAFVDALGNPSQDQTVSSFIWNTHERGKYDSEHDLYQFSFMGYSGRYFMTKKYGVYEIVSLDNSNPVKITYNSSSNSFVLYDEKGNRYDFDIKETTTQSTDSQFSFFGAPNPVWGSHSDPITYISAFHLSKVYDPNGKLLIEYKYNDFEIKENYRDVITTTNTLITGMTSQMLEDECPGQSSAMEPQEIRTVSSRNSMTKKLIQIDVKDKEKIDFSMSADRNDTDNEGAYKLNEIIIKDNNGNVVKRVKLEYGYYTLPITTQSVRKRLSLSKVTEIYGSEELYYNLFYKPLPEGIQYINKDYWGYPTTVSEAMPTSSSKEANPLLTSTGILEKMTLPTGGAVVYDFEANRYSHVGNQAVTDFDSNPLNWLATPLLGYGSTPGGTTQCGDISAAIVEKKVKFYGFTTNGGKFSYKEFDGNNNLITSDNLCSLPNCESVVSIPLGHYIILYYTNLNQGGGQGSFRYTVFMKNTDPYDFLLGGGVRIKTIGYFEDGSVPQDYYYNPEYHAYYTPSKEKNYDYTLFSDVTKSSGSLVFPKPVFEFNHNKKSFYQCNREDNAGPPIYFFHDFTFKSFTTFNNLMALRTKGADIGYKNVQVTETGNGYARYEYKSPIDVPEDSYALSYPYLPSTNKDHKRGLITKENIYDQSFKKLTETEYDYVYDEGVIKSGYKIFSYINCPLINNTTNHDGYVTSIENCGISPSGLICGHCVLPVSYIGYGEINEAFGWAQMSQKITRNYFYDGSTQQGVVENKENFVYNPANKKISSYTLYTGTAGIGETVIKEYSYYTNTATNNIGNLQKVVSKKNGSTIATQNIIYSAANFKPLTMQESKGTLALENKVQFVSYDDFSNIQEVKKENGTSIVYIWGYNKTQPIAMIEGAGYATVMATASAQINAAIAESNLASVTDASLKPKLNAIRTALPSYMVSTYTYKPGVGVTATTDAKGLETIYEYDVQNRLKTVKDFEGKLLIEHQYNYRPQF